MDHANTYLVIKPWIPTYSDPLVLNKGDRVTILKEDTEYPGWFWCERGSKGGWVPGSILMTEGDIGIADENYSAIELDVKEGDLVVGIREVNGWIEARKKKDGKTGWIPMSCCKVVVGNV